jgi:hypothetical protein
MTATFLAERLRVHPAIKSALDPGLPDHPCHPIATQPAIVSARPSKRTDSMLQNPLGRALATGKPQITGLFTDPMSQKLTLAIIVPAQIESESHYAPVGSPDLDVFAGPVAANELRGARTGITL